MVDKSRERANNGVGLGLSICAEIAKFQIDSDLNKGTTIRLVFNN